MTEPIFDSAYWKRRLAGALTSERVRDAIFQSPEVVWDAIRWRHTHILRRLIRPTDSILDAGCGWGRLLGLLPSSWEGRYLGLDLSPDFINMARTAYPERQFHCWDLRNSLSVWPGPSCSPLTSTILLRFDWCVVVSLRDMVRNNTSAGIWEGIETNLRKMAKRLLILEYDEDDEGEVVESLTP